MDTVTTTLRSDGVAVPVCKQTTPVPDDQAAVLQLDSATCTVVVTSDDAKLRPATVRLSAVEKPLF